MNYGTAPLVGKGVAGCNGISGRILTEWVAGCYRNQWPDDSPLLIWLSFHWRTPSQCRFMVLAAFMIGFNQGESSALTIVPYKPFFRA